MNLIANLVSLLQQKVLSKIPRFAEDAFLFIVPLGVMASVSSAFFGFLTCLVFIALIICFFRDPERTIPDEPNVIVSPADGEIKEIEDESYPGSNEKCKRITIFLSVLDVHINRIPIKGTIEKIAFKGEGKYLVADRPQASEENIQNIVTIRNGDTRIVVKQIVGLIARRIVCWAKEGDEYQTGERFGLIRFGSRVDIFVPLDTKLAIKIGDKVEGGSSIIGYLT